MQLGLVLATLAADGKLRSLAEMLDWRKAGKEPAQGAAPKAQTATSTEGAEKPRANAKATPDAAPAEPTGSDVLRVFRHAAPCTTADVDLPSFA